MKKRFEFGTCTVPNGTRGAWTVDEMTLTKEDVLVANPQALRNNPTMYCPPGTYKRLWHNTRGCVMSNTPMERRTAMEVYHKATGDVLVNGLGLGMVLEGLLSKPDVRSVVVVELDQDVVDLVGPHFTKDPRVTIICGDAHAQKPAKGQRYDYVWHDIWDQINSDNLPDMAKLTRKYGRYAAAQGVWSRDMARKEQRKARSYGW